MTLPPGMLAQVADVFRPLQQELLDIHIKWSLYRQLFGTDEGRISLLNRVAPVYFGYAERIQYDDLILSLFRFTDSLATGGKPNLTLDRLASVVKANEATFGLSIQADAGTIDSLLAPHADWRDHRLAHNDLARTKARWSGTSTLIGPSREQIEEILDRMRQRMNRVATHYGEDPMAYEALLYQTPGDAETLVAHLEDSARRNTHVFSRP